MDILKILIADDNPSDLFLLQKLLEREGHQVYCAKDGKQAIELFQEFQPDLILLDALMPSIDGFATARKIKQLSVDAFIPIIFITGLEHSAWLEKCLDAGGDDVLIKPFNPVILRTKVLGFARMVQQQKSLHSQQQQLRSAKKHFEYEKEVAKNILDKVLGRGCLGRDDIRYLLSPLAVFNGDVLLAAEYSSGDIAVLLGDFTGHGLAAAIGAIPLAEIFYEMVEKGFELEEILEEINRKLRDILTVNVFCCASMFVYSIEDQILRVWNGGLPDLLLIRPVEGVVARYQSTHLPLGIMPVDEFKASYTSIKMQLGDKLLIHTDGVLEARNELGQFFGESGVNKALADIRASPFDNLVSSVLAHRGHQQQYDDLSIVEFSVRNKTSSSDKKNNLIHSERIQSRWSSRYHFHYEALRELNPAIVIHQQIMQLPHLENHSTEIFLVLSELINNAIEHGLLTLDSSLKQSADGFGQYYQQRKTLKESLQQGYINVQLEFLKKTNNVELKIKMSDSGPGFDHRQNFQDERLVNNAGHGIYLLKKLCRSVNFSDCGNSVEVCCFYPLENISN